MWYDRYMNHPKDCNCLGCQRIGAYNNAIAVKPSQKPCPSCATLRAEKEKAETRADEYHLQLIQTEKERDASIREVGETARKLGQAESALCRARSVVFREYPPDSFAHENCMEQIMELEKLLSSSAPCRHEAELERYKEAVAWALEYYAGDCGKIGDHIVIDKDGIAVFLRDELRRRAGLLPEDMG